MARTKTRTGDDAKQSVSRIPTFRTIEEKAEFWDTHDSAEFEDELEEVTDLSFGSIQSKDALVLRIVGDDLAALIERAREQGVSPAELARGWIQERLVISSPANDHDAREGFAPGPRQPDVISSTWRGCLAGCDGR